MNQLREEIKKLHPIRRLYFEYLYPDVRFQRDNPPITKERLLRDTNRKTLDGFRAWENTEEFKRLKALYFSNKANEDFFEIYENVSAKAKSGDEKAIKLFLALTKELKSMSKAQKVAEIEDDGLLI